jgi:transposase-like protein
VIQECLAKTPLGSFEEAKEKLGEYVEYYNFKRPHQGIENVTPSDRFYRVADQVRQIVASNTEKVEAAPTPAPEYRAPTYIVGNIGRQGVAGRGQGRGGLAQRRGSRKCKIRDRRIGPMSETPNAKKLPSPQERLELILLGLARREPATALCKQAGVSRELFYRWMRAVREAGLKALAAKAPGPKRIEPEKAPKEALRLRERVARLEKQNKALRQEGAHWKLLAETAKRIIRRQGWGPAPEPRLKKTPCEARDKNRLCRGVEPRARRRNRGRCLCLVLGDQPKHALAMGQRTLERRTAKGHENIPGTAGSRRRVGPALPVDVGRARDRARSWDECTRRWRYPARGPRAAA